MTIARGLTTEFEGKTINVDWNGPSAREVRKVVKDIDVTVWRKHRGNAYVLVSGEANNITSAMTALRAAGYHVEPRGDVIIVFVFPSAS